MKKPIDNVNHAICNTLQEKDKFKEKKTEMQRNNISNGIQQDFSMLHSQSNSHNQTPAAMPPSWQSLATPGSTVADYLSHLPASTLPLSLHHFLKYSAESIKKESEPAPAAPTVDTHVVNNTSSPVSKKKKRKKIPKEKKPRPKPGLSILQNHNFFAALYLLDAR